MNPPLSGRDSVSHSMVGRYTQARQRRLMGQNSKTLVTAGTIKRPLPCPVEGGGKTESASHNVKRKTEQEEKKKDKNENREKMKEN